MNLEPNKGTESLTHSYGRGCVSMARLKGEEGSLGGEKLEVEFEGGAA